MNWQILLPLYFLLCTCATRSALPPEPRDEGSAVSPVREEGPEIEPAPPAPSPEALEPLDRRPAEAPAPPEDEPEAPSANGSGDLSEDAHALFWGTPEDEPAEVLLAWELEDYGRHYLSCDERHVYLYEERLRDIGGGYVGVGSFQGYLFIGMMRPQLAWLIDYDPWIILLHRAYFEIFRSAATISEFLYLWDEDNKDETVALLRRELAADPELEEIIEVFEEATKKTGDRMEELIGFADEAGTPIWITDQETYAFVRELIASGRVRPMIANLFGDAAMAGIDEASRGLGVPIRALYLSNAEAYWDEYPAEFRQNVLRLWFDDTSFVLRTYGAGDLNPDDYFYGVQPALLFQRWLRDPEIEDIGDVWDRQGPRENPDFPLQVMLEEPTTAADDD